MAVRIAVSIRTLADEVLAISPQTTIYFYDNGPARDSDHDPNSYGVICACDIMQGHGLNLAWIAQAIVDRRHPECKYVIFNKRIASRNTNWEWVDYDGESDHSDHIHVSVGIGPDGYSRPPYDSNASWGIEDMSLSPTEARVQKVINYRVEAIFANRPVCRTPAGDGYPELVETNQLYLALQRADDEFDANAVAQLIIEALQDDENPTTITPEQVSQLVEAVLNRTHLVVQGT